MTSTLSAVGGGSFSYDSNDRLTTPAMNVAVRAAITATTTTVIAILTVVVMVRLSGCRRSRAD